MRDLPVRHTSRLIVLDPADRILMIRYEAARVIHPERPADRGVWFTPGGGIEPGETPEEAARRELAEETGMTGVAIGPCIATRSAVVDIFMRAAFTHERYFLVRAASPDFDNSRLAETDADPVLDMRWRTPAEMRDSEEYLIPRGLTPLYLRLVAGDVPREPVNIA